MAHLCSLKCEHALSWLTFSQWAPLTNWKALFFSRKKSVAISLFLDLAEISCEPWKFLLLGVPLFIDCVQFH